MKFGKYLLMHAADNADMIHPEAYMDYKRLKKVLKNDREAFFHELEVELFKVRDYINMRAELTEELCSCKAGWLVYLECACRRRRRMSPDTLRALSQFVAINREGFRKILKKHDKRTATNEGAPHMVVVNSVLRDPVSQLDALIDIVTPRSVIKTRWLLRVFVPGFTLIVGGLSVLIPFLADGRLDTVFYFAIMAATLLGVANAANDACNSVGTAVGAGVLTVRQAVLLGAFTEFVGAITMGSEVSKSISKGIIEPNEYAATLTSPDGPTLFSVSMLCVLLGAGVVTLLATVAGWPISATHSIIGGLVAVGWIGKGRTSVGWNKLGEVCVGWVGSPLAGLVASFALYVLVVKVVLQAESPRARSRQMQPFFFGITVFVLALFFFIKGPPSMHISPMGVAVGVAVAAAVVGAGLFLLVKELWRKYTNGRLEEENDEPNFAKPVVIAPRDTGPAVQRQDSTVAKFIEMQRVQKQAAALVPAVVEEEEREHDEEKEPEHAADNDDVVVAVGTADDETPTKKKKKEHKQGDDGDNDDGEEDEEEDEEEEDDDEMDHDPVTTSKFAAPVSEEMIAAEKPFMLLLLVSAVAVAAAHASNDVGNAVGPLSAIFQVREDGRIAASPDIPFWALCVGAGAFALGILVLGSRTIATVSTKITRLTPSKSFATQMGAAIAVMASSALGLPVSTSHCLIGSVIGVGLAQRVMDPVNAEELNVSVLKRIVTGWIVTIPLAMAVSIIFFWPLIETEFEYTTK